MEGVAQFGRGRVLPSAALFLVLALTLTGCGLKKSETTELTTEDPATGGEDPAPTTGGEDLSTILPASLETELDTHFAEANAAAKVWQADAVLTYVSVDIPTDLAPGKGNEVYVFGAAGDQANWWTYSISQASGKFVRALIPKEDYLGTDIIPINTDYWTMNYVEAFQLAEANGGASFRLSNPGATITLFLSNRAPRGWLWWSAEYAAPSGEKLTLLINPFRGEVVDEQGTEVAPPADGSSTSDATSPSTSAQTDTSTSDGTTSTDPFAPPPPPDETLTN